MSAKDHDLFTPETAAETLRKAILSEEENPGLAPLLDLIEQMTYLGVSMQISAWSAANAAQEGEGRKVQKYKAAEARTRRKLMDLVFSLKGVIEGDEKPEKAA